MRQQNDELKHYGKKGMKWGVRKDKDSPNPVDPKLAGQKSKQLTTQQLRAQVKRMELERSYQRLQKERLPQSGLVERASKFVGSTVKDAATQYAANVITNATTATLDATVGKAAAGTVSWLNDQ